MNDNGYEAVKKLCWTHFTNWRTPYSQSIINHYQYVVEAADYKIMINAHGPFDQLEFVERIPT
jgi:hypothetical protein